MSYGMRVRVNVVHLLHLVGEEFACLACKSNCWELCNSAVLFVAGLLMYGQFVAVD